MMKYYLIALVILSFFTHFVLWGYPNQVVFDEVHFGSFATQYLTGTYFFDLHPPLGKLLISSFGRLGDTDPNQTFTTIGKPFGNTGFMWLRFLPTLAGALLPIVIFLLALRMGLSKKTSFFAGLFIILENSLLVQSRFILLDSLLLLFGFSGLLFYLAARSLKASKTKIFLTLVSAVCLSFAFSVKWTGLAYLGIVAMIELYDWSKTFTKWRLKDYLFKGLYFILLPLVIYFSIFAVHFALLDKSGPGNAFMTPSFQKTLADNPYQADDTIKPENTYQKFIELNKQMYTSNQHLESSHPYASAWYTWPILKRPIYYWNHSFDKNFEAKIYLIGNPLIYCLSFVAVLTVLFAIFSRNVELKKRRKLYIFLLGCYLMNLLPFILVGRQMFLYHYEAALVFAVIILAVAVDSTFKVRKTLAFSIITVFFLASFLYLVPLTYGIPLTIEDNIYSASWWPSTWR